MKTKILYTLKGLMAISLIGNVALGNLTPVVDIKQQANSQEIQAELSKIAIATTSNESFTKRKNPSSPVLPPASLLTQLMTYNQRIARLEQQMNNFISTNVSQQIMDLQQQLAQTRGQIQEQQRDLQLLNNQLRSFYNDLNQRIIQLKNLNSDILYDNPSSQKTNRNSFFNNGNIQLKDFTTYQTALNFFARKQYDRAEISFRNYLNDYPNGNYIANAHYWLGEIYLKQNNRKKAALEFQTIKDKFPKFEKVRTLSYN